MYASSLWFNQGFKPISLKANIPLSSHVSPLEAPAFVFVLYKPLPFDLGMTLLSCCIRKVCGPNSNLNKDSHVLASELWFPVVSLGFSQSGHNNHTPYKHTHIYTHTTNLYTLLHTHAYNMVNRQPDIKLILTNITACMEFEGITPRAKDRNKYLIALTGGPKVVKFIDRK